MNSEIVVTSGQVFAISSGNGDILGNSTQGLYAHDTRFLSEYRLRVHDRDVEAVSSGQPSHATATFYTTNRGAVGLPPGSLSIIRDRYLRDGLHEDIVVINHSLETRHVRVAVVLDADFADVFEVRVGPVKKQGRMVMKQREGVDVCLTYRFKKFQRETWVLFTAPAQVEGKTALFDLSLQPKDTWRTCVTVLPVADPMGPIPQVRCVREVLDSPLAPGERIEEASSNWSGRKPRPLDGELPRLITDKTELQAAYSQALSDLRALRLEYTPGDYILAAGLPWYMAVFGRDSIISAIQTKLLGPELMIGTLRTLASLQATRSDLFREAQPGKIPHEVRLGELAILERVPHSRYYGSVDSTPLFLVLLWEAYQWTGDLGLVQEMLPAAQAALRWIDRYGDPDGDGFVEHRAVRRRRPTHKLRNQGWKDSGDAISFADGRLAEGSLALAEVQGYVYDAKRKMAELYRALGEVRRALRLEREARQL